MEQDLGQKRETPDRVECQPAGSYLALGLVSALCGVVFMLLPLLAPKQEPQIWIGAGGVALFFWLIGLLGVIWDHRSRIIADEHGLRWRQVGRWRSATWAEVEDFYLQPLSSNRSVYMVRTRGGTLRLVPSGWTQSEELARIVVARAGNGPAEGWRPLGARRRDGASAVFRYDTRTARLVCAGCVLAALVLPVGGLMMVPNPGAGLRPGDAAFAAEFLATALAILLVTGLVLPVAGIYLGAAWLWWRHRRQVLEVAPSGLVWRDGDQCRFIPWNEVVEYGYRREHWFNTERYVLGASGEIIRFQSFLPRSDELQAMIQRLAVRVDPPRWVAPSPEVLGSPRMRWRGGARVYHYRTRLNRLGLWGAGAVAMIMWFPAIVHEMGLQPEDAAVNFAFINTLALSLDAVFLWLLLCYYRSAVLVDKHEITQEWPLGRKRLAWTEVRRYGVRGSAEEGTRFVSGEGGVTLRFHAAIAEREELQREIAARAPHPEGAWPAGGESLPTTSP